MYDFGFAKCTLSLSSSLAGIDRDLDRYAFDLVSSNWGSMKDNPITAPAFVDSAIDPQGSFAALYPSLDCKVCSRYHKNRCPNAKRNESNTLIFSIDGILLMS